MMMLDAVAPGGAHESAPLVTVYVPSHDYGRYLPQALDSVLAQIYTHWELIIIDDGSDDDTARVAEHYVARYPQRVRFLRNDAPQGLQVIANRVLEDARGKYLVRLDADDWFDESALLVLVARAEASDSPAIVYGGFHYVDAEGQLLGTEPQKRLWDEDRSGTNPPHGAGTLVSVSDLRAAGGYATDIDAQDGWDLWFRLVGSVHTASVTTPLFFYRQHGNSLSRNDERLYRARSRIMAQQREARIKIAPRVLAVVPVRASNPDLSDVPFRSVAGRSVLERTLIEVQSSFQVTDAIVTSEDERVLRYSEELESTGLVAAHLRAQRPVEFGGAHVPLSAILRHAGEEFILQHGTAPDVVIFLSVNAVLRTSTEITNVIDTLLVTGVDTVVSVDEERDPIFIHSPGGLRIIGNGRFDDLLYRDEQVLRFNGIAVAARWSVVTDDRLWGGTIASSQMPRALGLTLTDEESLGRAERILSSRAPNRNTP